MQYLFISLLTSLNTKLGGWPDYLNNKYNKDLLSEGRNEWLQV